MSAIFPQFLSGIVDYAARSVLKRYQEAKLGFVVMRFHARFMQTAFSSAIIERLFLMEMF